MNLPAELLAAKTKAQVLNIARYIGDDNTRFKDLMQLLRGDNHRVTPKAAWVLSHCADKFPLLIQPYLPELIAHLEKTKMEAVKRNILRVLQFITVPADYKAPLVNFCFTFLATTEPVAVKVCAMTVLANMAKQEPDLKNELFILIEDQLAYASPAFVARAKKILSILHRLPSQGT